MFKKSAIFKQQSFTQHALCCKARDPVFWEAVGRVPFDQRKFRKFEPVIFVEWKAPQLSIKMAARPIFGTSDLVYVKVTRMDVSLHKLHAFMQA